MLKEINTPVVILDRPLDDTAFDGVFFDDTKGMYDATRALIDRGHKKIGIINGTLDRVLARIRQKGYIKALEEAGILPNEKYMFFGDYSMPTAYMLSKKLLCMQERPTAVITCNNMTTMGFLKALYERGESVPESIEVIGLDKIEALDMIGMKMGYIERNALELGQKAMELLIARMAFPDSPQKKVVIDAPVILKS